MRLELGSRVRCSDGSFGEIATKVETDAVALSPSKDEVGVLEPTTVQRW